MSTEIETGIQTPTIRIEHIEPVLPNSPDEQVLRSLLDVLHTDRTGKQLLPGT